MGVWLPDTGSHVHCLDTLVVSYGKCCRTGVRFSPHPLNPALLMRPSLKILLKKEAQFWERVEVHSSRKKCWPWKLPGRNSDGYGEFQFWYKKKKYRIGAHRAAYLLSRKKKLASDRVIRHVCDHPWCCNPYHMHRGSHNKNVQDRVRRGRSAIGSRSGRAKLTETDIPRIRRHLRRGRTPGQIAREYAVDPKAIRQIRNGETWKHVA